MRRREFMARVAGAAVASPFAAFAQASAARRPLVAVLINGSSANAYLLKSFLQGMQEFGYVEGRDIDVAYRYADGDLSRLPDLAIDLAHLKPAVFVTGNVVATLAIRQANTSIPIVNPSVMDPVGFGLAASVPRPRGQVTGIMVTFDSLIGKQLELLLKLAPRASRLGMLVNVSNVGTAAHQRNAEVAAVALGITFVPAEIRLAADIDAAFNTLSKARVEILLQGPEVLVLSERNRIAALAAAARIPAIYGYREHVEDGGLMSYGVNLRESYRHAAAYVDKILKGTKPGDLPLEFPSKLELVINLKTARALGLTVPTLILARADDVIE
jgi:putative tryptophan/tyrosine transport system substrate-binding protein